MHPRDPTIDQLARRHENVITRAQVLSLGAGPRLIARRLENGRWQRLHNGIYLVGPAPPTPRARARAALLACGEGAVLSHRTAAEMWGMLPPGDELHVTVPGRNPGQREGVRVHRVAELPAREVAVRDRLPLTSPARTICDIAGVESVRDTEDALTEARVRRLVTDRQLLSVIERAPTRRGSAVIRALLSAESEAGYTRSRAERRMQKLLRAAELPQPRVNQALLGYLVDFLWAEQKLIVEVDGYESHGHRAKFESDRRRDQRLMAGGYRVIRVTWRQLRDAPLPVIASMAQAIALTS
jgi:very-short-patch-repair endonuclease